MTQYSRAFPWARDKRGQGFFIPCLNSDKVRKLGLSEALRCRIFDAKAYPAVHKGLSGVWFYR
jgi:hypothetical protein